MSNCPACRSGIGCSEHDEPIDETPEATQEDEMNHKTMKARQDYATKVDRENLLQRLFFIEEAFEAGVKWERERAKQDAN